MAVRLDTIVNKERSLLFCAPPNTGPLQFRMLAKRMQGISHWSVADDWSRLFDPAASELELLDATDGPLMAEICWHNGSGWMKIAVVRDPVTRLLSAYLDIVHAWRAGLHRQESPEHDRSKVLAVADRGKQGRGAARRERRMGRNTARRQHNSEWSLLNAVLERRRQRQQQGGSTTKSRNRDEVATAKTDHQREEASESEDGGEEELI